MDPINLHRQLRNNSNDLMNFCADLKQWGEDMKQKDRSLKEENGSVDTQIPHVRNKIRKKSDSREETFQERTKTKESKRIKGCDYSSWEKYDVDAECSKIDKPNNKDEEEDESSDELTDESDETLRQDAIYEKEKGNKFVKKAKWCQAIECYTKAIECYAYDPIFYANRALCHLKNLDYRLAESDCTTAIQLDKTYVKAYHRRAMAREALNQLNEAHDDLMKIFDYEPDNKECKTALAKLEKKLESVTKEGASNNTNIEQKPKSKFTISRQQQKALSNKTQNVFKTSDKIPPPAFATETINTTYWPSGNDVELINTVNKAPHLHSKIPLRRIQILDGDLISAPPLEQVVPQPLPSINSDNSTIKCDDFKIVERKIEKSRVNKTTTYKGGYKENIPESENKEEFNFLVPDTSVQFNYDWRLMKNKPESQYLYLKQVPPKKLKTIFHESLECDVFSGILKTLAEMFTEKNNPVHEYLLGLADVKRFNMLVMFMSDADKKDLQKLIDYMLMDTSIAAVDINNITNKYTF